MENLFGATLAGSSMDVDTMKRMAGIESCRWVSSGMSVGLGTGSTVAHTVIELGRRVREEGLDIVGVPTSIATMELATEVGIPLTSLSDTGQLDIVIDGTDEYDPNFTLIKGGGGALTREKVVAQSSNAMVVVADRRKRVDVLGAFPLPVEVLDFEWMRTRDRLNAICPGDVTLRGGDTPFITDNGGLILDCEFGPSIMKPTALEAEVLSIAGVVEVGLFCGLCDAVVLANGDSVVTSVRPDGRLSS